MSLVDANIVLRYLLDDHAELSPQAADILERHSVTLPVEVGCEVVYVLQRSMPLSGRKSSNSLATCSMKDW